MSNMKTTFILILFSILILSTSSFSQVSFGTDIYSRYIWRGMDFGDSPSFQPSLTYTLGGFSIGEWGAYSFAGIGSVYSEDDLLLSYSFSTSAGSFSVYYTDYYFPSAGLKYSNYKNDGNGAHTLEAGLSYSGPSSFPLTISGYVNVYNDPDKSSYFEVDFPFTVSSASASVFVGASGGKSANYQTDSFSVINMGVTFTKSIPITDKFSLPIHTSLIINPKISQSYLIVGISL